MESSETPEFVVAGSTRDRLLGVLAELSQERALDRIAIVDIAQRAGVSRPTVVRHLGDKRALRRLLEETRGQHAPESQRERLLHAALIGWGEQGDGPPSLADLARQAGLAKSSIAWHFPHKSDLLIEVAKYLTSLYDTTGLWEGAGGTTARELREGVQLLLRRRVELAKAVPRVSVALAWLRRAGPEGAQTELDRAEREFRRGVAAWLRSLALRGELEPGVDREAWIALLETLMRDLEQRVGQQSWPERIGALLVTGLQRP